MDDDEGRRIRMYVGSGITNYFIQMGILESKQQPQLQSSQSVLSSFTTSTSSLEEVQGSSESCSQEEEGLVINIPSLCIQPSPFIQSKALALEYEPSNQTQLSRWLQVVYHPTLLNHILEYLSCEDDVCVEAVSRRLKYEILMKRVRTGYNLNCVLTRLKEHLNSDVYAFYSHSEEESQHSLDLDRTSSFFQEHNVEGQVAKLDHVMTALSFSIPYFQGLNSIAATLLHNYSQPQAYWICRYLIHSTQHIHNHHQRYTQLMEDVEQTILQRFPRVHYHLQKYDMCVEYFAMRWVMGLFSYDLTISHLLRLWCMICMHGVQVLKWFIIGIISEFQESIVEMDDDELNERLKMNLKGSFTDTVGERVFNFVSQTIICRRYYVASQQQEQ